MIWRLWFVTQIGGSLRYETKKRARPPTVCQTPYNRPPLQACTRTRSASGRSVFPCFVFCLFVCLFVCYSSCRRNVRQWIELNPTLSKIFISQNIMLPGNKVTWTQNVISSPLSWCTRIFADRLQATSVITFIIPDRAAMLPTTLFTKSRK